MRSQRMSSRASSTLCYMLQKRCGGRTEWLVATDEDGMPQLGIFSFKWCIIVLVASYLS